MTRLRTGLLTLGAAAAAALMMGVVDARATDPSLTPSPTASPWYAAERLDPGAPHVTLGDVGLNDDYTSGSYRSIFLMIVGIIVVIAFVWLAYGWALGIPGAPRP